MASHRTRPAATDYFNPAEQIELLHSIKAKVEKSTTATPQPAEVHLLQASTNSTTSARPLDPKPVDFKAHEVSLREKLEKAKADREAKAKAEAQQKATTTATDILPSRSNDNNSTEPTTGPPPPPILNTSTATALPAMAYTQSWGQSIAYPQVTPMTGYRQPYAQYPQVYQQYGMQPYVNGHPAIQAYQQPQPGQYFLPPTPGVPNPPPQPNQGPSAQGTPSQGTPNQGPIPNSLLQTIPVPTQISPTQTPVSQTPPNQGVVNQTPSIQTGLNKCRREY
jgi:hypothetical protein